MQFRDDAIFVGIHSSHIHGMEFSFDTEGVSLSGAVGDLSSVEEGLGGDTTSMETSAAKLVALDEGDLQTELRRSQGGGVTTRSATQDNEIKVQFLHP